MKKLYSTIALILSGTCFVQITQAAEIAPHDQKYLTKTAQGLMAEIQLGEMAQKRGHDERVRDFGKRMVEDHGKDLGKLKDLAAQKKVTLPDSPDADQRKEADKLEHLSNGAFDKEYVRYEAKDHKDDVKDQGTEMKKATDPDIKNFASGAYETVVEHRKIVDDLQRKINGK